MQNTSRSIFVFCITILAASSIFADNIYTDTFLQPSVLADEATEWSLWLKAGVNEGSSEITSDGLRFELPRLTLQKNVSNEILFRATVPYVYVNDTETNRITLGDPSFFTTLQLLPTSTFTVGVTEPAANRDFEPDVVRFMIYYTQEFNIQDHTLNLQAGTEITDRYAQEGQDDLLSFGASYRYSPLPIQIDIIKKQVVDGKWWDITKPLDSPLNRLNITLSVDLPVDIAGLEHLKLFSGIQTTPENQYLFGIQVK